MANPLAVYVARPRGPSSRDELELAWDYPVLQSRVADPTQQGSRSVQSRTALTEAEVFRRLAGEDARPLLVLRECTTCSGTDDALLTPQEDNEKTLLLSRWFHCVKVPANVVEEDHPFHAVFAGESPAHLFVARPDGTQRVDLKGDESRTELWKVMEEILESEYTTAHDKSLKLLARLLDKMDEVDLEVMDLEARLDDAIEKSGPDSSKAKKTRRKLEKAREELAEIQQEIVEASTLELRPREAEEA